MLHDVTVDIFTPGMGTDRQTVQVDAVSGDDAVSQAMPEAARRANGRAWKIVGVNPSTHDAAPAPVASLEGDEAEDDLLVPDELEAVKRGPGRPRKAG